jgi:hypothetical protein
LSALIALLLRDLLLAQNWIATGGGFEQKSAKDAKGRAQPKAAALGAGAVDLSALIPLLLSDLRDLLLAQNWIATGGGFEQKSAKDAKGRAQPKAAALGAGAVDLSALIPLLLSDLRDLLLEQNWIATGGGFEQKAVKVVKGRAQPKAARAWSQYASGF